MVQVDNLHLRGEPGAAADDVNDETLPPLQ
jgi:hypothetical protein